jgi:hypothetical protein
MGNQPSSTSSLTEGAGAPSTLGVIPHREDSIDTWTILEYARRKYGDKLAIVDGGASATLRTYEQFYVRSCLLASYLLRKSLGKGAKVRACASDAVLLALPTAAVHTQPSSFDGVMRQQQHLHASGCMQAASGVAHQALSCIGAHLMMSTHPPHSAPRAHQTSGWDATLCPAPWHPCNRSLTEPS